MRVNKECFAVPIPAEVQPPLDIVQSVGVNVNVSGGAVGLNECGPVSV